MKNLTVEDIDALLPQTQCGLCGYQGCLPYASALLNNSATINLCPPGGVPGLLKLANLLEQDPEPFIAEMTVKAKPPTRAHIREAECIGCTKCITACPVDAIIGTGKLMHTVMLDECSGCELCIAPCPVDCIDMLSTTDTLERSAQYRQRYQDKNKRLQQIAIQETIKSDNINKNDYILAALARAANKVK